MLGRWMGQMKKLIDKYIDEFEIQISIVNKELLKYEFNNQLNKSTGFHFSKIIIPLITRFINILKEIKGE